MAGRTLASALSWTIWPRFPRAIMRRKCRASGLARCGNKRFIFSSKPEECPAVADARALQQDVRLQTHAYLSSLTDRQLITNTDLHFPDGDVATRTPALLLHH